MKTIIIIKLRLRAAGVGVLYPVGVANPASEFCIKQGGKSEIKKDKDGGEYGVCHLSDGTGCGRGDYPRGRGCAPPPA